ncbi:MAG: hypothetical protein PVJ40_04650 [Gammaproteobacteria bacterium]|jgi:hypothetical protein
MTDTEHRPEEVPLATREDNREAAARLARMARRSLAIFTRDLEPALLDQQAFVDPVRELATGSRYARIRILVLDATRAVREGHRLVNLAGRLTSFIEIRRPGPDHRTIAEAFMIADENALLWRPLADRHEGSLLLNHPIRAREKLREFDEIWAHAEPESEFRHLGI